MSETIKVIMEIPKETYLEIRDGLSVRNAIASAEAIKNGKPLSDVLVEIKAEIDTDLSGDMFDEYGNETRLHKELMEILDRIDKESEEV